MRRLRTTAGRAREAAKRSPYLTAWARRAPKCSVLVCGMPRSGTTLLSGLLMSTKRMGRPGEWFNPAREPRGVREDYARFVDRVVRSRAAAGVFAVKFLHHQLWYFLDDLRPWFEDLSDRELLERVFPQPRFVWVERGDVVAQAVSWWRADKTDDWKLPPSAKKKTVAKAPPFRFDEAHELATEIERGNERWKRWFAANEIEPHIVLYEDLAADQVGVTSRTLEYLGIEVRPGIELKPRTAKQADELNAEWIARYREMAAVRTKRLP